MQFLDSTMDPLIQKLWGGRLQTDGEKLLVLLYVSVVYVL